MASTVFPAASAGKTMYRVTLTSGTSYTVPTGALYLNVTLYGGGGGAGGCQANTGGNGASSNGSSGGSTTFTGATSASGGSGGARQNNGAGGNAQSTGTGTAATANSGLGGESAEYLCYSGGGVPFNFTSGKGMDGNVVSSTLSSTPGGTIAYAIGASGGGGSGNTSGVDGGSGGSGKIDIEYWA